MVVKLVPALCITAHIIAFAIVSGVLLLASCSGGPATAAAREEHSGLPSRTEEFFLSDGTHCVRTVAGLADGGVAITCNWTNNK